MWGEEKEGMMLVNGEGMFWMMERVMRGRGMVMWMVGLGRLFGGGMGVWNMMMVRVKEGSREIGIGGGIGGGGKEIVEEIVWERMVKGNGKGKGK